MTFGVVAEIISKRLPALKGNNIFLELLEG